MSGMCERKCCGVPSFCSVCDEYKGCTFCNVRCKCDDNRDRQKEQLKRDKQDFAQDFYSHVCKTFNRYTSWNRTELLDLIEEFAQDKGITVVKQWYDNHSSDEDDLWDA